MSAQASGCGSHGTPKAAAMHSLVMSSCVGPMPPLVNTWSKRARTSFTVPMIVSGTSGITRTSRRGMPSLAQAGGDELDIGILGAPRQHFVADDEHAGGGIGHRKSLKSGMSGLSAGGHIVVRQLVGAHPGQRLSLHPRRRVPVQRRQRKSGISKWNRS